MSDQCHVCGPVRHACPTVICAPCALAATSMVSGPRARLLAALIDIRPRHRVR